MSAKVIKLNRSNFHKFIEDVVKAYDENRLDDFICIVSTSYSKEEEIEGFNAAIGNYWFTGENGNCVSSLGLLDVMKQKIHNYIAGENEGL